MKKSIIGYFLLFAIPALGTSTLFAQQSFIPSVLLILNEGICSIMPSYYGERLQVCREETCANEAAPGFGESCEAEATASDDGSFYRDSRTAATSTAFFARSYGGLCETASYGGIIEQDSYGELVKLCDTVENVSSNPDEFGCGLGIDQSGDVVELCDATENPMLIPNPQFNATFRRLEESECTTNRVKDGKGGEFDQTEQICATNCFDVGTDEVCDTTTHYY